MTAAPLLTVVDTAPAAAPLPRSRARAVHRARLVDALALPDGPPLAVLVAPAGFGKTTLLLEWSAGDPRPFAWVTLNRRHDDSRVLLRSIARAVDAATAEAPDRRIVLVLDDVHVLRSAAAHETIAAIATELPAEITVALASRAEPALPIARLRAQGLVSELRHGDLAMTRSEAAVLMRSAGLQLGRDDLDVMLSRTEGWPAALSLAALALDGLRVPGPAIARFSGLDRLVAEYVRDEVLAQLSDDDLQFVMRSSILEMLTASACDAILERPGSADTLARLLRAGFPLVALDRTAERYRHHRVLHDVLGAELRRAGAEQEAALHRRASGWYERCGDRDRALHHALAADEVDHAGDLVWAGVPAAVEQGACASVEHRLSRFDAAQIAGHRRLALSAAGLGLVSGRGDLAAHWLAAAEATGPDRDLAGTIAALTAALGREGLARMASDADRGSTLLAPNSPCQALCALLAGVSAHLRGDRETAWRRLDDGARRAAVAAPQIHALCLAQLALVTLEDNDAEAAAGLSARARAQVARFGLERYPISALVLAVSALVRAQRGRVEEARSDAGDAAALLERLTDFAPWYEAEVQVVLARAALRLSDLGETRVRMAQARRLAARIDEAVELHGWLHATEADLEAFTCAAPSLPSSLTTAELRILHFLPTHLSFREIAERTFVSANTVKTQANAVYRKLDVRSRSDAVARARELGLLDA